MAGPHTLQWDLDYNNTVVETNETNNSAARNFTAGVPTAPDSNYVACVFCVQYRCNFER